MTDGRQGTHKRQIRKGREEQLGEGVEGGESERRIGNSIKWKELEKDHW